MQNPYIDNNTQNNNSVFSKLEQNINDLPFVPENFNAARFISGVIIGAGIAYLLTNEKAQKAVLKSIAKAGDLLECGFEELKERFEDEKAEINAQK